MTPNMINSGVVKVRESLNICTWMQVMGKEAFELIDSVNRYKYLSKGHILSTRKTMIPQIHNSIIWVYGIHNGKMLYTLSISFVQMY